MRIRGLAVIGLTGGLIAAAALGGCESQQPATRAGMALDRAGTVTGNAVGGAANATGNAVDHAANATGNYVGRQVNGPNPSNTPSGYAPAQTRY
jgi:hypothetical protein